MKVFVNPVAYLDLNHYINLAQGIKIGDSSLFNRLLTLVQARKVAIPASAMLMTEILNVKKPQQRKDLGNVVGQLCNKLVIRDYENILSMQVTNKVAEYYGCGDSGRFLLPLMAFSIGYLEAFGSLKLTPRGQHIDPEMSAKVLEFCEQELEKLDLLEFLLSEFFPKPPERGLVHTELVEATRRTRQEAAGKSFEKLKVEYIHHLTRPVQRHFEAAVTDLGILVDGQRPRMPDEFATTAFLESIPAVHVWSDMYLNLYHRNKQTTVELNDMYDIAHLAVAVPYCDVVVCDKKMWNVLRQSRLDEKYGTKSFSKLSEAVDFLETTGFGIQ